MVPEGMATYGKLCGWTLARAHARTGDRIVMSPPTSATATASTALRLSKAYADQNVTQIPRAHQGGGGSARSRRRRRLTQATFAST